MSTNQSVQSQVSDLGVTLQSLHPQSPRSWAKKEFHWMLLKGHFWIIKFQCILKFRGKFFKFSFILFHDLRVSKDGLFLKWFVWRTSTNRYLHCTLNTSKLDFYLYLSPLRSIRSYHRAYLEQLSLCRFKIQGLPLHQRIV